MTTRRDKKRPGRLVLRLYVASDSPNSAAAKSNLKAALAHLESHQVMLETVDVLREPERGLADAVLVTPTLVKISPPPERRIIGTLRDRVGLLAVLGIEGPADE